VKVRFVDRIVYVAARTAIGIASRVPERIGYGIAAALGRLYFRCSRRRQQCALRFLRAAYPQMHDRERLRIGRIATGNICKVPIDMAKLTRLLARGGSIREVVDVGDAAAIVPQKPYLAVTAHLGSWEVAAVTMAQFAGEAHGVARTFKNPLLQRWILHNRRSGGLHIHPRRGGIFLGEGDEPCRPAECCTISKRLECLSPATWGSLHVGRRQSQPATIRSFHRGSSRNAGRVL
jgi:lauroyl/myristoyl acyltransferase